MLYKDIRLNPDIEKAQIYEDIHQDLQAGTQVKMRQHKSGFPAITVACGNIRILTDIISLETWWKTRSIK